MDRVNFHDEQYVKPSDLDTAFDDCESAVDALKSKAIGQGLIWGGKITKNVGDPQSVDISALYGHASPLGETVQATAQTNVKCTHTGFTSIGVGGQADGAAITVPTGHRVWVAIGIKPERNYDQIVKTSPVEYWRNYESYKFVLAASSSVASPSYPSRPSLPAMDSFLFLGDVLLKNDAGSTEVELVDHSRRTPWTGGRRNLFQIGCPGILNEMRLKDYDTILGSPGDPIDMNEFLTLALGLTQDFAGSIFWTMKGAFLIQKPATKTASAQHALMVTIPVLNSGASALEREIIIKTDPFNADSEADFLEFHYFLHGAPLSSTGWANLASGKHVFAENSHADHSFNVSFQPGRNLLRFAFVNLGDDNITAHCAAKFLDHADLGVDRELMAGMLNDANHEVFFGG